MKKLEHNGIINTMSIYNHSELIEKDSMARLVMMPSYLEVHDHQLVFQIISRVGQFHHRLKRE